MQILAVLFWLPSFLVTLDFFKFLFTGKRLYNMAIIRLLEVVVIVGLPLLYSFLLDNSTNECCSDTATFSPEHRLTVYVLISICIVAYFYSSYKAAINSPVLEVLTNVILILGITFNVFLSIHEEDILWTIGNLPI